MIEVVVVAAKRTATGSFQGALAEQPATALGSAVIKALLDETGIPPEAIEQVIMGQVLSAGCGQNPARQTALLAGLPATVNAMTVNKVCGSGLKAVHLAMQAIQCGEAEVVIAGGQENMSLAPHILNGARQGLRLGHSELKDTLVHDGLWDAFHHIHMGVTAENVARQFNIPRSRQDEYAAISHQRALKAQQAGHFRDEIVPFESVTRKGEVTVFSQDEGPRETSFDKLSQLKPAFEKAGTVTAGNASSLNDGAAAILLCSRAKAESLGLVPLATLGHFTNTGITPEIMGAAPIDAIRRCLEKQRWDVADVEVLESNEAFAAQALAVLSALHIHPDRVNPYGGAIALGHAIGASGCRILVTLIHNMKRNDLHKGVAALCIGGGEGVALAVQRD
ncbi:acetyl-CoA C-acetyltransferase [Ewingella americana]|jgi:acetyl-CoA C-acetyltransferase|uniref:Acetyl-CoA C-acetyltransferase n=1 Tax=Ewingella americana TaxID=41202 RepID=A0A502G7Q0_9GAMM|nr:acetyl-CoA C-acetyltransferase [Ewingella americana]TPG57899.1 acetyl-CoA C-acetyltransferase [Ewingella americana]